MPEDSKILKQADDGAEADIVLGQIDRLLGRFENILSRRLAKLGRAKLGGSASNNELGRFLNSSASSLIKTLFSNVKSSNAPEYSYTSSEKSESNSRFQSSSGQLLADLAANIRRIGGRNL